MKPSLINKIQRGLHKPPQVIARRLVLEARRSWDRLRARVGDVGAAPGTLLVETSSSSISELWSRLAARPYFTSMTGDAESLESYSPGDRTRILADAERAIAHRVNLLGTGEIDLGETIDWSRDYKTGATWPKGYSPDIDYTNLDRPSDVKVPWEISRLQWLIPAGQAYRLTGQERYAAATRECLEQWMDENPCMAGVNWACTMEVALRLLSWTWFFHVFHASAAWADDRFRTRLLCCLFTHARFTEQYLEYSDINGNHCTADLAAMVVAGLFFGQGRAPQRWLEQGWKLLVDELPKQVTPDGVDFEASIPYHRLVLELFLLPAVYRQAHHLEVPESYRERLSAMARFTRAYSRADGGTPLSGDADDARALPLGCQGLNDHRYLLPLVGVACNDPELFDSDPGSLGEAWWLLGPAACERIATRRAQTRSAANVGEAGSAAFPDGGCYVFRRRQDHVFIDCGPIGLAGRGGHGHNDCLSFEAALEGAHLITDCGAFVYTASPHERNLFRSTAYHNTPSVDGAEINRFVGPLALWTMHYDARPQVRLWRPGAEHDLFVGSHSGYSRLEQPVTPVRALALDHQRHALVVYDRFECADDASHAYEIPLHLALDVKVEQRQAGELLLHSGSRRFVLAWHGAGDWKLQITTARVSPSYGVARPIARIAWRCVSATAPSLLVTLAPENLAAQVARRWTVDALEQAIDGDAAQEPS